MTMPLTPDAIYFLLSHFFHFSKTNKSTNKRPNKTKVKKTFIQYVSVDLSDNKNREKN